MPSKRKLPSPACSPAKRVRFSSRLAARAPSAPESVRFGSGGRVHSFSLRIPRRRAPARSSPLPYSGGASGAAGHRRTGEVIRAQGRVAREPCQSCLDAFEECFVGDNSARCAYCAERGRTVAECGVDSSVYDEMPGFFSALPRIERADASAPVEKETSDFGSGEVFASSTTGTSSSSTSGGWSNWAGFEDQMASNWAGFEDEVAPFVTDDLTRQGSVFSDVPSAGGDLGDQGSVPGETQAPEGMGSSESSARGPEDLGGVGFPGSSSSSSEGSSTVVRGLEAVGSGVELLALETRAVAEAVGRAVDLVALEIRALADRLAESDGRVNALVNDLGTRVDALLTSQTRLRGDVLRAVGSRSFSSGSAVSGLAPASNLAGLGVSGLVFLPPPVPLPRGRGERERSGAEGVGGR